ncbi:right-handed parallel beta-helix repeat-containing protein [Pedobacter frigoris]|uniref:Uncharacterized protein n=1 Tax=Pedobacter frigoris TaxID=2571272 RepID=A0A4U1CNY7_9SPHI|nr:right-handed parallel beta-helix repeat-containing protein [Pedobacter frigoris]TKC07104.1 hypothetical protein FA047_07545 [Pedobacter frigoris]
MTKLYYFILLAAIFIVPKGANAHTLSLLSKYYIDDVNGSDSNNGATQKQAWKTLDKINAQTFKPGDQILFKRGGKWQGQLAPKGSGSKSDPIIFSVYGKGNLPVIAAEGKFTDAVLLKNMSHIALEFLDISNLDPAVKEQKTGPTGVRILSEDIGTIANIRLSNLYVHDINGDNKKGSKEGHGIYWDCQGPKPSNIDGLLIENCKVVRVDRNGIRGNGTFGFRNNWFPNRNLVIRGCTIEDIGGDGIVVKAFDGSVVEYNKLFHIRTRAKDNAVGIWPHSSDNTLIQFNEVAYTQNDDWSNDGQSFDIDGNCNNTIIQNNYSHDNEGGFMLVISDAINAKSKMTKNSIIRDNLSINDGNNRRRLFNFALVTDSTMISGNVFYNNTKDSVKMEMVDIEHGIPKNIVFENNIFRFEQGATAVFTKSEKQYGAVTWKKNTFNGNIIGSNKLLNVTEGKTSIKEKDMKKCPWTLLKKLNMYREL